MSVTFKELSEDKVGDTLVTKLHAKSARVGIIGMGYVGLPLALSFARAGFATTGFDIDPEKVSRLGRGESYIRHVDSQWVAGEINSRRLAATTEYARLREMDAIIVCVPTPLDHHREPDLSFIRSTAESIAAHLRRGQLVVLESTTYPGTTEELVLPILEGSGLRCPVTPYITDGRNLTAREDSNPDFLLAFSPEREDPGNQEFRGTQVPKVIGGTNAESTLAAQALYRQAFERTHLVCSTRTAEMTKLLENIFRCVNIALVNELKLLCLRMGIDIWDVLEAAKTKPFGFMPFYPGPGLGGHCIPIDPFYLTWKAREYEFPTRFIELAGEINTAMPYHVVAKVAEALAVHGKTLLGAQVLILGAAYKRDVDDTRESPALRIMELLYERGARVSYHDPHVPRLGKMRKYNFGLESVPLSAEVLRAHDCALIVTDHSCVDYRSVVTESPLVVDTRNATHGVRMGRSNVICC